MTPCGGLRDVWKADGVNCPACAGAMPAAHMGLPLQREHQQHHAAAGLQPLRWAADQAEHALRSAVEQACPGPHNPRQHRDSMPPWCRACGRTARGVQIPEERRQTVLDGDYCQWCGTAIDLTTNTHGAFVIVSAKSRDSECPTSEDGLHEPTEALWSGEFQAYMVHCGSKVFHVSHGDGVFVCRGGAA